jgi:two-component system sensor histidine kinase UhpB
MPARLSLRFRLNLMIALAMLLILGLGFLLAVHSARRSVDEEIRSTVNLALQLIEAGQPETRGAGNPPAAWLAQLGRLDRTRHLRIHIAGEAATVLNLVTAKSGAGAEVPAWFRWSVAPEAVVAEQRLADGRGGEFAIRIEADSGDELAEAWRETRGFLVLLLGLAGAVYGLVHVTVGRAFRSVGAILEGLENIEKGDYGKRLPDFPLPEFSRISGAFNHMAATLEKARDENRALTQQSLNIQEEERRYLAQELHDELGQSLTAIKVMAAALRNPVGPHREAAEHIMNLCDRLFGVVRAMMRRLRPSMLDELGLAASLEDLVEDWRGHHSGLDIDFACDSGVDAQAGAARIHLFRIVQECLTNAIKHAEAQRLAIRLRLDEAGGARPWIVLRVRDDGRGFDPRRPPRGFGLPGIRERVAGLGGRFDLKTAPGQGVAIEIHIPPGDPDP